MITEDYVSFEIAKLLKEKRFDPESITAYYFFMEGSEPILNRIEPQHFVNQCGGNISLVGCPTLQMAMKWLRKVYNICITIYPDKEKGYEAVLYNIKDDVEILLQSFGIYGSHIFEDSYEQAAETAIKYCLEHLI